MTNHAHSYGDHDHDRETNRTPTAPSLTGSTNNLTYPGQMGIGPDPVLGDDDGRHIGEMSQPPGGGSDQMWGSISVTASDDDFVDRESMGGAKQGLVDRVFDYVLADRLLIAVDRSDHHGQLGGRTIDIRCQDLDAGLEELWRSPHIPRSRGRDRFEGARRTSGCS